MSEENKKVIEEVVQETTQPNDTPMEEAKEEKVEEVKTSTEEKVEEKVEETKEEIQEEVSKEESVEENKEETTEKTEETKKESKGKKNFKKSSKFTKKTIRKPEFEQKIISLRRVTRVTAGGRRFSFSVAMIIGDKKEKVGFGVAKGNDVVATIEKATRKAKKNMYIVKTNKKGTVPYDVYGKYKASEVVIRPVIGKGLAAGGAVRVVLEFAGVKEAGAKILSRSKNHINNVRATFKALEPFMEKYNPEEKKKRILNKKRSFNKTSKAKKTGPKKEIKKD